MFHIGQLVVCIDDTWDSTRADYGKLTYPVKEMIYTIRGIQTFKNGVGVVLEEIVNEPFPYSESFAEGHWRIDRFRPIQKTSIEIFTKMLTPVLEDA